MKTPKSTFLKLALLTDDPSALLLAAAAGRKQPVDCRRKFDFETYEAPRFDKDFRFTKSEIRRLIHVFEIPKLLKTSHGLVFSAEEGTNLA